MRMNADLRVLFLAEGVDVPASRFRIEQFLPHLEQRGFRCTYVCGYGKAYNRAVGTWWSTPYRLAGRLKRAAATTAAPLFDVVMLQRTSIPQWAAPEWLASRLGARLVFDFDDAIFLGSNARDTWLRTAAFRAAVRASTEVIAGNAYLAQQAPHDQVTKIPTVVDTDIYTPPPRSLSGGKTVIGWMGTAGNFPSLRLALPAVQRVLDAHDSARLVVVSNATLPELRDHPKVEQRAWSRATELRDLQSFDIGLMPLLDNEWSLGKCGFKMIQYMATGTAVVGSRVGANGDIVATGETGILVPPGGDWETPLVSLCESAELRRTMSEEARRAAVDRFSVTAVVDDLARVLVNAARPKD